MNATNSPIELADLGNYYAMKAEAAARGIKSNGVSKAALRDALLAARSADAPTPAPTPAPAPQQPAPVKVSNTTMPFGSFVWYEFIRSKVTVPALRSALADNGFDAVKVSDIDETSEIKGAARNWKQGRGNADRYKATVAHEDDYTVTVGILRREQVATKKVGWSQVDSLTWDKAGSCWLSKGASPEADAYRAHADDRRNFVDHGTIRPILNSLIADSKPIQLRRSGGIWFVPSSDVATDLLPRLESFMGRIGDSYLAIAEQTSPSAKRATAREVRAGLAAHIAELREQITEWKGKVRNPRKDAVDNMLEAFMDLRDRADLYAGALEVRLDDLRAEIGEMETMAKGFVRDQSNAADRKRPSAGLLAVFSDIIDSTEVIEGRRWIDLTDLADAGLPSNMHDSEASKYWARNTVGVRAVKALGFTVEHTLLAEPDEPVRSMIVLSAIEPAETAIEE